MNEEQMKALMASLLGPLAQQVTDLTARVQGLQAAPPAPPAPAAPPVPPAPPAPAAPAVPPAPGPALTPEQNAQLLGLTRTNEKLIADIAAMQAQQKSDKDRADAAERNAAVTAAIGDFQFASPAARDTAISMILPQITRTDTGDLIAPGNLPPAAYVKDFLPTQHGYLLAPVNVGGGGLNPGTGARPAQAVDLNSIKAGMSPETRAAAVAAIQQAGANLFGQQ